LDGGREFIDDQEKDYSSGVERRNTNDNKKTTRSADQGRKRTAAESEQIVTPFEDRQAAARFLRWEKGKSASKATIRSRFFIGRGSAFAGRGGEFLRKRKGWAPIAKKRH